MQMRVVVGSTTATDIEAHRRSLEVEYLTLPQKDVKLVQSFKLIQDLLPINTSFQISPAEKDEAHEYPPSSSSDYPQKWETDLKMSIHRLLQ